MRQHLSVDREKLSKLIEKKEIGGNYTPFFCIGYSEYAYGKTCVNEYTQCHEIVAKSSISDHNNIWVFHIFNYFDEDPQERINAFLTLFRKTEFIHRLSEPTITIINDINIKIECNGKDYDKPYKKLFLLKLFRFSYFYHGETIGQLFLNQRYYKTSQEHGEFCSSTEAYKISSNPTSWLYSLLSFNNNNNDNNFLDSSINKQEYKKNDLYISIRNIEKKPLQFSKIPTTSAILINTENNGF